MMSVRDRQVGEDRDAEIAAQHVAEPEPKLLVERPVEAELRADLGDVLGVA